jgi:hypothetical protein
MLCDDIFRAADLNYCAEDTTIHVGSVLDSFGFNTSPPLASAYVPGNTLSVRLTDMSTDRTIVFNTFDSELPYIDFDTEAWEAVPQQMYKLQVVGRAENGGMTPLRWYPWTYDTTTNAYAISTTEVDAVYVRFLKVNNPAGSILSATEQWIVI